MLKKLVSGCAVFIAATAFSLPAQARVVHVSGAHVGHYGGARVAAVHRGVYRSGAWRGQYGRYGYGRYAYGYRPYWGAAGVAAGVAAGAAALAWPSYYGYAYDNGYNNGAVTYQGGPRYPYYQRPYGYGYYGYGTPYRNWTEF
jgi:hypothetical protein